MNWFRKRKLVKMQVALAGQQARMAEFDYLREVTGVVPYAQVDARLEVAQRIGELQASISAVLCEDMP